MNFKFLLLNLKWLSKFVFYMPLYNSILENFGENLFVQHFNTKGTKSYNGTCGEELLLPQHGPGFL